MRLAHSRDGPWGRVIRLAALAVGACRNVSARSGLHLWNAYQLVGSALTLT